MAFTDLTPYQAQLVTEVVEALASGFYKSEFIILYHVTDGGLLHLYGNAGMSDHEIKGFTETDIAALKEEGYLTVASRGKASLKPKAFKEYEKQNQHQDEALNMSPEIHLRRLVKLFQAADGSKNKWLTLTEVFKDEGLDEQAAWNEAEYMEGEGWVKPIGDNGPPIVHLTHLGIKTAESHMSAIAESRNTETSGKHSEPASGNVSLLDIFISHSRQDAKIAEALIDLLKAALNLSAERIRCTSVDGYKLPPGADVNEQLRREIYDAKVFVGIVTPTSLESTYVLFELGARWGAKLSLLPVLALATANILKEPLKTLNAGCLYAPADLHELIAEIARQLSRDVDKVAAYEKHIRTLVRRSKPKAEGKTKAVNNETDNKGVKVERAEEVDMQMYAQLCKEMEEVRGNTYTVEPGSPEHLWAERMVQKGLLKRLASGRFYSLP
jgi:hypothetical protein